VLLLACYIGVSIDALSPRDDACRETDMWWEMPRSSSVCLGALGVPEGDVLYWGAVWCGINVGGEAREGPPLSDGGCCDVTEMGEDWGVPCTSFFCPGDVESLGG
jgi:hypothetical protein